MQMFHHTPKVDQETLGVLQLMRHIYYTTIKFQNDQT